LNSEVGPGAQLRQRLFTDQRKSARRISACERERSEQLLKRIAKLILGLAALVQLGLGCAAKSGDGLG